MTGGNAENPYKPSDLTTDLTTSPKSLGPSLKSSPKSFAPSRKQVASHLNGDSSRTRVSSLWLESSTLISGVNVLQVWRLNWPPNLLTVMKLWVIDIQVSHLYSISRHKGKPHLTGQLITCRAVGPNSVRLQQDALGSNIYWTVTHFFLLMYLRQK